GLKTLGVRVQRQNESALALARMLAEHPKVETVYYAGLETHPSYAIAQKQMSGFGGVVSFTVKGGREFAGQVVDRVKIPRIAPSLGGVESLIEQPALMSYFELSDEDLKKIDISPALIRYAVGVEDAADLIDDLRQALG